jgi:hypothetical protein
MVPSPALLDPPTIHDANLILTLRSKDGGIEFWRTTPLARGARTFRKMPRRRWSERVAEASPDIGKVHSCGLTPAAPAPSVRPADEDARSDT